ncbi:hypothetical protein MBLNU459_g3729t1 [Dothideomycetes sp. NU459]
MAEIAAGAVVAEQVVATVVEGGAVAGYAVSKPTMPLKASFMQIATAPKEDADLALARSHHTLSVVGDKAYIFGGVLASDKLASNEIHTVVLPSSEKGTDSLYACLPAIPAEDGEDVPCARTKHAACTQGHEIAVFGGCEESGKPVDQDSRVWIWSAETLKWFKITSSRHASTISMFRKSSPDTPLTDTWFFDLTTRIWHQLPDAPVHSDSVALVDGTLYVMTKTRTEGHCHAYVLELGDVLSATEPDGLEWHQVPLPSEKPAQTPDVRAGAGLVPITTGYGRQYLAYIFGFDDSKPDASALDISNSYYADFWTYQVASKSTKPTSWTDFKPAALKDTIRQKLGYSSGGQEWGEVEVEATEQVGHEGKVHPGPRAFFGCDVGADGRSLVLWGGINPKGEKEADGWLIRLE